MPMIETLLLGAVAATGAIVVHSATKSVLKHFRPKLKGLFGERNVNRILMTTGLRSSSRLRNIMLSGGMDTSQIDNILVNRHGVFIIETKNYAGDIFCDSNSKHWRHRMFNGNTRMFLNPTLQNRTHVQAVQSLLLDKYPDLRCYPIVAFANTSSLIGTVPNVVNFRNLRLAIKNRCSGEPVLSKEDVKAIAKEIKRSNIKSLRKRRMHKIRANLAAAAAKDQTKESMAAFYEEARNTPLTTFAPPLAQDTPQLTKEDKQLSDAGSFLRIGGRTGSIEDFLEGAKRDERDLPVPRGAICDHFVCPYTGDRFPFSEFKSFYRGLWAAYLTKNPELVEYMQKKGPENIPTGKIRTDQVLQAYMKDPDAFLSEVKQSAWYKNMEQRLSKSQKQSQKQPLKDQIDRANKIQKHTSQQHKSSENTHAYTH